MYDSFDNTYQVIIYISINMKWIFQLWPWPQLSVFKSMWGDIFHSSCNDLWNICLIMLCYGDLPITSFVRVHDYLPQVIREQSHWRCDCAIVNYVNWFYRQGFIWSCLTSQMLHSAHSSVVINFFLQATIGIDFLSKTMYLEDRTVSPTYFITFLIIPIGVV